MNASVFHSLHRRVIIVNKFSAIQMSSKYSEQLTLLHESHKTHLCTILRRQRQCSNFFKPTNTGSQVSQCVKKATAMKATKTGIVPR